VGMISYSTFCPSPHLVSTRLERAELLLAEGKQEAGGADGWLGLPYCPVRVQYIPVRSYYRILEYNLIATEREVAITRRASPHQKHQDQNS